MQLETIGITPWSSEQILNASPLVLFVSLVSFLIHPWTEVKFLDQEHSY